MVAEELFNLFDRFGTAKYVGLEDFADKCSFQFSVIWLVISTLIVTVKSYVFKSISCYLTTSPGGAFESYVDNYCWVHGTVPFYKKYLPEDENEWSALTKKNGALYYQWVPFVLGLQTVMFYIPRLIWQFFCFNSCGIDLEQLIKQTVEISGKSFNEKLELYQEMADNLRTILYLHRDFRSGKGAELRRKIWNMFKLMVPSKRLGTEQVAMYFFIKLLYLANAIGQLFLIKGFLGSTESMFSFTAILASHMYSSQDWETDNFFPRITFCNIAQIRHLGSRNSYTAQCVLPVNMLNEKIYIFLWFWTLLILGITTLSIPLWALRLFHGSERNHIIKQFLKMHDSYDSNCSNEKINKFVTEFLRYDGLFLIRMIANNAGDVATSHIVNELWKIYLRDMTNKNLNMDTTIAQSKCSASVNLQKSDDKNSNSGSNHVKLDMKGKEPKFM